MWHPSAKLSVARNRSKGKSDGFYGSGSGSGLFNRQRIVASKQTRRGRAATAPSRSSTPDTSRLDGSHQIAGIIQGVKFKDGEKLTERAA